MRKGLLFATLACLPATSLADNLLEGVRDVDLNDYALGFALSFSESPYVGAEDSMIGYPYLTSFVDPSFTTQRFIIRDGAFGARWVTDNDWEYGLLGHIRTLSLGSDDVPELSGLRQRKWTVEFAPAIGYRGWPVHIDAQTFIDIADRHGGFGTQLTLSLPWAGKRGYLVPMVKAIYRNDDYTGYYYGVAADETTLQRPEYVPGAALNYEARVRWGYTISDRWLLSGGAGVTFLDSEISDSPIVDKDKLWSVSVGLAYNADLFAPRDLQLDDDSQGEVRIAAFRNTLKKRVYHVGTDNTYSGDNLGLPDESNALEVNAMLRLAKYHRVEFGYFDTERDGTTATTTTRLQTRMAWIGYGYSLMRDAQKELGLSVGINYSDVQLRISSDQPSQELSASRTVPLPTLGAFGSVALGEHWDAEARLRLFRLHFDHHEGSLTAFTAGVKRRFGDVFSAGLAYNYYRINLNSRDDGFTGSMLTEHSGPVFYLGASF